MKTFQILATSAALAAYAQAALGVWSDCTDFETDGYGTQADCELNEAFAQNMVETDGYIYASVAATNAEGYNLNMFRMIYNLVNGPPAIYG